MWCLLDGSRCRRLLSTSSSSEQSERRLQSISGTWWYMTATKLATCFLWHVFNVGMKRSSEQTENNGHSKRRRIESGSLGNISDTEVDYSKSKLILLVGSLKSRLVIVLHLHDKVLWFLCLGRASASRKSVPINATYQIDKSNSTIKSRSIEHSQIYYDELLPGKWVHRQIAQGCDPVIVHHMIQIVYLLQLRCLAHK